MLEPGHEQTWDRINSEHQRAAVPPPGTPVETLLRTGMMLSEQAFMLLNAIERPDGERPAQQP